MEEIINVNENTYKISSNEQLTSEQRNNIINQLKNQVKVLGNSNCGITTITQGTQRTDITAVVTNGTPNFKYEFWVGTTTDPFQTKKTCYPSDCTTTTTLRSITFPTITFDETPGTWRYTAKVIDSCLPTNKTDTSYCDITTTPTCTPTWVCEIPLNGYENDGCGNRRLNSACDPFRTPPCDNYGDVDNDGYVTSTDANWILEYTVGSRSFTDEQRRRADVNANGIVDTGDATLVLRYASGLDNTFPICSLQCPVPTVTLNIPQ